jgi:hypothetical protein
VRRYTGSLPSRRDCDPNFRVSRSGRSPAGHDLFDSDLDALADVLDQHRAAALGPSSSNGTNETDGVNVPGTLEQTA